MSALETAASWGISILSRFVSKSTAVVTIGSDTITAGQLESAAGNLASFWTSYQAAVKAKNYNAEFELGVEEAAVIAADFNVPFASLASQLLPLVFYIINANGLIQVSPNSETGNWKDNF